MKKKIINGILLVAMLIATTSTFVSCKDNDSDVNTELQGKIAKLQEQINELSQKAAQAGPQGERGPQGPEGPQGPKGEPGDPATIDDAAITKIIAAIQDQLDAAKNAGATEAQLESIATQIAAAKTALQESINGIVTDVIAEGTFNPLYGSLAVPGVKPLILAAYYNEPGADKLFPEKELASITGAEQEEIVAGDMIISEAGTLYLTLNPTGVNIDGKALKLVNSQGEEAPIKLEGLKKSDAVLTFGWNQTRADNGFYEATATLAKDDIEKATPNIDLNVLKDDVQRILNQRTTSSLANLVADLYANASNVLPAYALNVSWNDKNLGAYSVNSGYEIAATAIKPLQFGYKITEGNKIPGIDKIESLINKLLKKMGIDIPSTAIEIKGIDWDKNKIIVKIPGQTIGGVTTDAQEIDITNDIKPIINGLLDGVNGQLDEVNKMLKSIQNLGSTSSTSGLGNYIDQLNKAYSKFVNNIFEPTLLVKVGNSLHRANGYTPDKAGEITLIPTTWSAGMLAPAYKKFVVVTNDKAANKGDLGKVIDGGQQEVKMTVEAGKTYEIAYSAIDYFGNIVTNNYVVVVEK